MSTPIFSQDDQVKSLSIRQPYAQLILPPGYKWETRTWWTAYRGWVLICSTQYPVKPWEIVKISGERQIQRMDQVVETGTRHAATGMAIGLAYLSACRAMEEQDEDRCYVQFDASLYCHIFDPVYRIEVFPFWGYPGYKRISDYDKNRIKIISPITNQST